MKKLKLHSIFNMGPIFRMFIIFVLALAPLGCKKTIDSVPQNSMLNSKNELKFMATAGATVFNFVGADQSFVVPAGITQITVKAWGAGGAGGNYVYDDIGGGGGFVTGILNVTPGEQLTVVVGGGGQPGAGLGAYGGGGDKACGLGGRGGGRSAVINSLSEELITAGAGGGGGGVDLPSKTEVLPGNRITGLKMKVPPLHLVEVLAPRAKEVTAVTLRVFQRQMAHQVDCT